MKSLFVIATFLLSSPTWAQVEVRSVFDKAFSADFLERSQSVPISDTEPSTLFTLNGKNPGQRLLTEDHRSLVSISSIEDLDDLPSPLQQKILQALGKKKLKDYFVFANFKHRTELRNDSGTFYVGLLPRNFPIKAISREKIYNSAGIPVAQQLKLNIQGSMKVIPQESDEYPILTVDSPTLIYGLKILRTEDDAKDNFDIYKALTGQYGYAMTLSTVAARKSLEEVGDVITVSSLNLSPNQMKALWAQCLQRSNSIQESGIYNFLVNNHETTTASLLSALEPGLSAITPKGKDTEKQMYRVNSLGDRERVTSPDSSLLKTAFFFEGVIKKLRALVIENRELYSQWIPSIEEARTPSDSQTLISTPESLTRFLTDQGLSFADAQTFIEMVLQLDARRL